MDYQSMKRRDLQALCKKHGVPANLSNREMADRLSSIVGVHKKLTSSKKVIENKAKAKAKAKVVKKVRFSPENQIIFYEISGYKRGGRRRCTLKLVPKKQIQPTENDLFSPSPVGRKRARLDVKKQSLEVRSADECNVVELGDGNVTRGLIRRQLRNKEVVVGQSDGDSVISKKKVTHRGSKIVRNTVLEDNVIASKDAELGKISKTVGRITRSHAQFACRDSENEEVEGDCEKSQLEEPSKHVGRNALMPRTAKVDKDLQKRKQLITNDECKMINAVDCNVVELGDGNGIGGVIKRKLRNREAVVGKSGGDLVISRKKMTRRDSETARNEVPEENIITSKDAKHEKISKTVGRITRSQVQFESEKDEGECEKAPQPKALLRVGGRNALMRKRKQDVMNDECCKILNGKSRKVENVNRSTGSRAKTVVDGGTAEGKNKEEIVQPEEPSKGLGKYNLRKKSVVPSKGKVGNDEVKMKKENRKRSKNDNLEGISELEAILDKSNDFEMVKNVFVPSGPSRRTRCNSVIFVSTDTTNEGLENHQNIGQKDSYVTKNTPRRSRQNVAGKAFAESHPAATEMGTERTTKFQLSKDRGSGTAARMFKLTSKSEEVKKAANQSVVQSTVLERSNANLVGQEEVSGKGAQNYDEIIFKCETSISNAWNEICNQAKAEGNVTINSIEPEEVLYNERTSQVVGEMIINEDYERNLLVGGSAILISEKTDGKDAKNKETEVLEGYAQDAMWRANEFSEQIPNNVSKETRGRCLNELSDAKGINMINMEETGTDSAHGTINKGSFPYELDSLKNHTHHKKGGSLVVLPIDSRKSLSTSKDKLLTESDMQETFIAELNENVGGLKVEVQEQSLLQLALEDLRDGIEGATPDANSNSGKVLCQLRGNCNSLNRREKQVYDDIYRKQFRLDVSNAVRSSELVSEKIYEDADLDEENSSVDIIAKDVPFNEDYAANKGIDDKGSNGESDVEQCADITQEENPNCTLKVELREQSDNEVVAPQENGAAGTSLTALISKESEVSNESEVETTLRSAECIERVDNLSVKESKSVNRNSHTVVNDVGALAQATSNHLAEQEAMETHDGSVQNIRIAVDEEAHAVSIEKGESLGEAENFETSVPVGPEMPRKTSRDEFAEICDSAPGVSNEVPHPNVEDLEGRTNDVVGFVPPADKEQVCVDIYSKEFPLDESNAMRSSELILEKIYDVADSVRETNSSVDITAEDVPFNEDYAASQGIDGKGFNGESDVDQCADVAEEENPNCALNVELRGKSDNEAVVPQENGTAGTSLTEFISKECEVSSGKEVETMLKSAECIEKLDNLPVKVCKSEKTNYRTVGNDVGPLAQATSSHLVEEEAMETHDGSLQNIKIAVDEDVHAVSIEKRESLGEAEDVETSVPVSPEIPRKTSSAEICDSVPGVSNEVLHGNGEDLEERSNDVVGFVPPTDGARFGDLDNYNKQTVLELERSTPVISDDLMSMSSKSAYRKENARITASDLHSNDNRSDAEKEDNEYAISQVAKKDRDDHLPEVKLCNANDSDCSVWSSYASSNTGIAADASEVAVDRKVDSENLEAGTKCLEKTPTFDKQGEKNSSEGRYCLDTSFDKPEMGSANDAVDMDSPFKTDNQIIEKTTLTDQKDNEGLNDSIHGLNIKDKAGTANEQCGQKDAVIDTGFPDGIVCSTSNKFLCSERRKSITEVAEEVACSDKVCNMVVNENIEELPAVSSSTPRMSVDFSAFSPSIEYSKCESKSSEFQFDFPQLTNWAMNKSLGRRDHVDVNKSAGGILEGDLTTQDYDDAMQGKENLRSNDLVDQQTTEKHLDEMEHHTYRTVSGERICDNGKPNWQNGVSAISQEDLYYEIQKDKSNPSLEQVMLEEETITKGSNIADLDELKAGYVSDDLNEAEHIVVDPVFSCSRSRVNSMDEVHTEATEKMNMQEVKNVGTILPVTPQEPSVDCENTRAASHEISGTILQQIFQSCSGWKEKICDEAAYDVHCKDYSNDARRTEMGDEDIDNEAMIGNNEAADSFSLEHNVNDSQEVKDQLIEREAVANEATFEDDIQRLDDKIVATIDFNKVADFENSIVASTLTAEMAVDCSGVSTVMATSNHENKTTELNVESHKFTSPEMNLFPGSRGQDETKNSDSKDVIENAMIMEQVVAKFPEEQLSEQKKAEEVSEFNSALHSDLDEPTTQQQNMLAIIHGTPDNKKLKNEPLKFETTNLAAETAAENAWTLELKLLSPQQISPESKTRGNRNSLFAKKLNSSTRKQNNKSNVIRRTPKQLGHDMKENFPSTKKQKTGNFTAHKSLPKRRALENIQK